MATNRHPRILNVVAAVVVKGDKYLAARRKRGKHLEGLWEFPGGKINEDESHEDCLKRELLEEFGTIAEIGEFITSSEYDYGDFSINLVAYEATISTEIIQLIDHDEIRWCKKDELLELEWAPADIPILNHL